MKDEPPTKYAEQMPDEILSVYDGFTVRVYTGYILVPGDVVKIGENPKRWGVVVEDDALALPSHVTIREFGDNAPHLFPRSLITYEQIHQCECGAYGGEHWRICHPDA